MKGISKRSMWLLAASLLWGIVIFLNSLLPGDASSELSNAVVVRLPGWLSFLDVDTLTVLVRKSAHVMEYLILGGLAAAVFDLSGKLSLRNTGNILFPCLFWAVLDEVLQTFVEGRTGLVRDVAIDFGGILTGVLLFSLLAWLRRRRFKRQG